MVPELLSTKPLKPLRCPLHREGGKVNSVMQSKVLKLEGTSYFLKQPINGLVFFFFKKEIKKCKNSEGQVTFSTANLQC